MFLFPPFLFFRVGISLFSLIFPFLWVFLPII